MTVPTIGGNAHYVAFGTPKEEFPANVCRAAVITEFLPYSFNGETNYTVGVAVLNPTGMYFNRGLQWTGDVKGGPGTCHASWACNVRRKLELEGK